MVATNGPLDAIKFLLGSLKEKEIEELKEMLGVMIPMTMCQKSGHKYKKIGEKQSWLWGKWIEVCCEKCGHIITR